MSSQPNQKLMQRVTAAAESLLRRDGMVTYPALLRELGVLAPGDLDAWRAGRVPYLEKVINTNLTRLARIQTAMRRIARERNLERRASRPPRGRRYSKTGHPFVEEEYGAIYQGRNTRAGEESGG